MLLARFVVTEIFLPSRTAKKPISLVACYSERHAFASSRSLSRRDLLEFFDEILDQPTALKPPICCFLNQTRFPKLAAKLLKGVAPGFRQPLAMSKKLLLAENARVAF